MCVDGITSGSWMWQHCPDNVSTSFIIQPKKCAFLKTHIQFSTIFWATGWYTHPHLGVSRLWPHPPLPCLFKLHKFSRDIYMDPWGWVPINIFLYQKDSALLGKEDHFVIGTYRFGQCGWIQFCYFPFLLLISPVIYGLAYSLLFCRSYLYLVWFVINAYTLSQAEKKEDLILYGLKDNFGSQAFVEQVIKIPLLILFNSWTYLYLDLSPGHISHVKPKYSWDYSQIDWRK